MKLHLTALVCAFFYSLCAFSQLPVSITAQNKNVLLEEYTGLHCSYCPDGAKMADEIREKNIDDVFLITWHIGIFAEPNISEPEYRTTFGSAIETESGVTGYPGGSINRHIFSGSITSMSRYSWEARADQTRAEASYVNIAMDADINLTTRVVTVDTEIYFTGSTAPNSVYFNLAMTQENIIGPQNGKEKNPHYTMPDNEYRHMHMLRHLLTGQWGDTLVGTAQGTLITRQYQYTVPADINGVPVDLTNIDFIGFIAEGKSEVITVENAYITFSGVPAGVSLVDIAAKTKMSTPDFCDPNATPVVTIYNNCTTTIDTFEVSASFNNGTPDVQLITTPLLAGDSTTITFSPVVATDEKNVFAFNVNVDATAHLIDTFQSNQYSHSADFYYMESGTFGTSFTEDFESYNHGVEYPNNAFLITPPVGEQAYIVDNDNLAGVNTLLGGFWNSQQSYRWKLPFIPSGTESSLVYKQMDFSTATGHSLEFSYAYSQNTSNSQDSLNVDISTDCNSTWTNVFSGYGSSLATAPGHSGFFYPEAAEWLIETVDLSAFDGEDEVILRFRVYGDDGASLFIDDIEVSSNLLSTNEIDQKNNFMVSPNPATEQIFVYLSENGEYQLIVHNLQGQQLIKKSFRDQASLNVADWDAGLYIFRIVGVDGTEVVQKVSVQ